jgi:hypothetical protein
MVFTPSAEKEDASTRPGAERKLARTGVYSYMVS